MTDNFIIKVTNSGTITFPSGCADVFEAIDKVNARHNIRYVAQQEAEHEHQLQPLPTRESIYQTAEDKRIKERMENICLVRAYLTLPTWKKRMEYLKSCGYKYTGANSTVHKKLQNRVDELTQSKEWQELVKVVEGN